LRCRNWRTDSDAHVLLEQAETARFDRIQRFFGRCNTIRTATDKDIEVVVGKQFGKCRSVQRTLFVVFFSLPIEPAGVAKNGSSAWRWAKRPSATSAFLSARTWCCRRCRGRVRYDASAPAEPITLIGRPQFPSLVKTFAIDLIAGAAKSTIGTMIAQAASQEVNHSLIHEVSAARRKHAIAEAIADVIPDWITANKKCA